MSDHVSTDLEGAAYLARTEHGIDDRPTRDDCERDESPEPYRIEDDVYRGTCGGCLKPVSAFHENDAPHDDDPLFDIVLLCAAGGEEEARETWGDRAVDPEEGEFWRGWGDPYCAVSNRRDDPWAAGTSVEVTRLLGRDG